MVQGSQDKSRINPLYPAGREVRNPSYKPLPFSEKEIAISMEVREAKPLTQKQRGVGRTKLLKQEKGSQRGMGLYRLNGRG